MGLRIGVILACAALSSAVNGCGAEKSVEASHAPQAQVDVQGADESAERPTASNSPEPTLSGRWAVRALVGPHGESVLVGPYADELEMTFTKGHMSGHSGCNSVFGTYEKDREDLTFPPRQLGSTLVGCDEPPLVRRLLDVRHVSGAGDVRYLHADNWMIVAALRRH
jgi:heat shock protein HslJ